MAVLINGNGYSPVTAQQDADLYAGILGQSLAVLDVGQKMAATIIDNNTVRIGDGEAVCQGRRLHNDPGEYDDFTIPTGSQGITSYYIIGYHIYSDAGGNELAETFVQKMNSSTETITEAVLRDGAVETYISFYRVTVTGLTITAVTALYKNNPVYDYQINTHQLTHSSVTLAAGGSNQQIFTITGKRVYAILGVRIDAGSGATYPMVVSAVINTKWINNDTQIVVEYYNAGSSSRTFSKTVLVLLELDS